MSALAKLPSSSSSDEILDAFLTALEQKNISPYAEQEEAILELYAGNHVILNTPTGSGKSLVASALHYLALCREAQSVYTCPIKALVNEKFMALCREYGAENVGMMTGDASINADAPILCCTAEILANIALLGGERAKKIAAVIMDEFHYYSDAQRGVAWQVPLLLMPWCQFLLMSATIADTGMVSSSLQQLSGKPVSLIANGVRPVPLEFCYNQTPLHELLSDIVSNNQAPVYVVYFTQKDVCEAAADLASMVPCPRETREKIAEELGKVRFNSPFGNTLKRCLSHGVGLHHAGLLPRYRLLVEKLAQQGLLRVICGTDTLGVGINVPIRSVVFSQLFKYNGDKAKILSVRDFRQIAGRAGRKGYDDVGYVYIQAPEHVIANKRAEEKSAGKKGKKPQKQKPAEGEIVWDENTYNKLMTAPSEPLQSRFQVSHGMLLNVLRREEDGCKVMRRLIGDSHETAARKKNHRKFAWKLFRSLLERNLISIIPADHNGRKIAINVDLQEDFSLNHALSLFFIDTTKALHEAYDTPIAAGSSGQPQQGEEQQQDSMVENISQPAAQLYALNLLSCCEAIIENPQALLRQQLNKAKTRAIAEMKADNMSFEERQERLLEIEYPKPLKKFLEQSFDNFSAKHPWVSNQAVQPKSIAREMYERYIPFGAYVKEYGFERQEGVLLRYLSQCLKLLVQNVPPAYKTEEVYALETYLRQLILGIDSSLLEEWQRMIDPAMVVDYAGDQLLPPHPVHYDILKDGEFDKLLRHEIFLLLRDLDAERWEEAAERLGDNSPALRTRLEDDLYAYFDLHDCYRLDPAGRALANTTRHAQLPKELADLITDGQARELVCQRLIDWEGHNDHELRLFLNVQQSREQQRPVLEYADLVDLTQA